jgi:hypothetical protein
VNCFKVEEKEEGRGQQRRYARQEKLWKETLDRLTKEINVRGILYKNEDASL